ncbi:MAG: Sulphatase-modifying factor protein [Planctomycetaceae bacterium]|nr:Sulphatase-modifying factor protein [Planctomycetaceae bacterium]
MFQQTFLIATALSLSLYGAPEPNVSPSPLVTFDATHARSTEDAQKAQAACAKSLGKKITSQNSIGMILQLIPSGEFIMGSSDVELAHVTKEDKYYAGEDEGPRHKVQLTKPFSIGRFEVTQDQWMTVMGRNPSFFSETGKGKSFTARLDTTRLPVESVSWFDAVEFCNKLSALEGLPQFNELSQVRRGDQSSIQSATVRVLGGLGYRLPTEAEWEFACRAGTQTPFHFGARSDGSESNLGEGALGGPQKAPHHKCTTIVGSYGANSFGLFDMHGNVGEWCEDFQNGGVYKGRGTLTVDPRGYQYEKEGREKYWTIRGGSWESNVVSGQSGSRNANRAYPGISRIGFRVAKTESQPRQNP